MTKEQSEEISGEIAALIANEVPYISYTAKDIKNAKRSYTEEELELFRTAGMLTEDFELFYVIKQFCDGLNLWERADGTYLSALFRNARKFGVSEFYNNPYMKTIEVSDTQIGDFLLTNAIYDRGEFFQYDMPDLSADIVVPKIGFFTGKVHFPSIYEGRIPWMSVCPSEISSMAKPIGKAHGKVLVLGLGLGYYPFMISLKEQVERITIIEKQAEIINIFKEHLLPQFPEKNKIQLIEADAFVYLENVKNGEYDFCFADIWENQVDGADAYVKIKDLAVRLPATEFTYWIEDSIKWYLD